VALVFRSPSRTLTDDEVNGALRRIQDDVTRSGGYQIRK
jgi:phenylalanyl-tRNA synthetase beta subunit